MAREQHAWTWIGWLGMLLGISLIVIQARLLGSPIFDLAFHIPLDPAVFVGDTLIVISILFLIWTRSR
jgi:hypothetical protein